MAQKGILASLDTKLGRKLPVETEILVKTFYEEDDNKGFSNRDITILSMNKTQKYLRY